MAVDTQQEVILPVSGMTCASCVRRVEKALTRVPGVDQANVNLATEKARIVFDPSLAGPNQLAAAVEKAGYHLGPLQPAAPAGEPDRQAEPLDDASLQRQKEMDELRT